MAGTSHWRDGSHPEKISPIVIMWMGKNYISVVFMHPGIHLLKSESLGLLIFPNKRIVGKCPTILFI